jgi:hypothetical protein
MCVREAVAPCRNCASQFRRVHHIRLHEFTADEASESPKNRNVRGILKEIYELRLVVKNSHMSSIGQ